MRLQVPVVPRRVRLGMVGVVAALLLVASVVPVEGTGVPADGQFGVVSLFALLHVLGYGTLAVALGYAMVESARPDWLVLTAAFLVAVTYGAAIEGIQGLLPHRLFSYTDIVLNAVGAGVAVVCWGVLGRVSRLYQVSAPGDIRPPRG